ncbi:MAG: AAA family ATPase [Beutenbergiaceae bacterium]
MQIGTRVWAAGKWRALDTAALFKQQGAIRAMGTAVIAAHPELVQTLAEHGLTLDPVSGEVSELEPFNAVMSKRSAQINRNLDRLEAEWQTAHPGETPGPVVTARMQGTAWAYQRPGKKPADLKNEQWWQQELAEADYDPATLNRVETPAPASLDDVAVQEIASRALDRCTSAALTWTRHTIQEQVTRITTEHGVQAAPAQLREFIAVATDLATDDCFSVLPPDAPTPEHVAHLTSVGVLAAETALRDQLAAATPRREPKPADVSETAHAAGLDEGQAVAAAAVASRDPLVLVEGAAGAGKTTMLGVAIEVAAEHGRPSRVVAPTLRAAQVALVGDRAQLPAVGRGGVLDMAAQIRGRTYDMSELHRFIDPEYAALTLTMRDRENPSAVFDRLAAMHLVTLHADDEQAREHITENAQDGEAITVATNDEAAALNERIRAGRVERGEVHDTITATGSSGSSSTSTPRTARSTRVRLVVGARTPAPSNSLRSMWVSTRTCPTLRLPMASKAQPSMPRTRCCRRLPARQGSTSA